MAISVATAARRRNGWRTHRPMGRARPTPRPGSGCTPFPPREGVPQAAFAWPRRLRTARLCCTVGSRRPNPSRATEGACEGFRGEPPFDWNCHAIVRSVDRDAHCPGSHVGSRPRHRGRTGRPHPGPARRRFVSDPRSAAGGPRAARRGRPDRVVRRRRSPACRDRRRATSSSSTSGCRRRATTRASAWPVASVRATPPLASSS